MRSAVPLFIFLLLLFLFIPHFGVQFVVVLLGIIILTGYLSSRFTAAGLRVVRKDSVINVYRGQSVNIEFDVQNHSVFSQDYLFISDDHGPLFGGEGSKKMVALKPGERCIVNYSLECRDRGSFTVGPLTVRGTDVFGFFPWIKRLEETTELNVYPSLYDLDALVMEGLTSGNLRIDNPLYEDVTRYRSIREYVPGDDLKRIHWKISAKMGSLHTREFLPMYHFSALLVLNLSEAYYSVRLRTSRMERAVETAAALVLYSLNKGQQIGFLSNGSIEGEDGNVFVPVRGGYAHSVQILQYLAKIRPRGHNWEGLLEEGFELPFGTRVFYVGPPMDDALLRMFISRWGVSRHIDFFHIEVEGTERSRSDASMISRAGQYRSFSVTDYGSEVVHV